MALRKFSDRSGCVWNVWNVERPSFGASVQEHLREGWLCFQQADGGERYRIPLGDVPPVWEELPPERLDLIRRIAVLSPATGPMRRVPSPERRTEDAARERVSGEHETTTIGDESD